MAGYRDELEAAALRITTLEARLEEQQAKLTAAEASAAAHQCELEELRNQLGKRGGAQPPSSKLLLMGAVAAATFVVVGGGVYAVTAAGERGARDLEQVQAEQQQVEQRFGAERERAAKMEAEQQAHMAALREENAKLRRAATLQARRQPVDESGGKFDPDANMKALREKMATGTATESELMQLRALCSNAGDRPCRDLANTELKALRAKRQEAEERAAR